MFNLLLSFSHDLWGNIWDFKEDKVLPITCTFRSALQVSCYQKWGFDCNFFSLYVVSRTVKRGVGKIFFFILTRVVLHKT